MDDTVTPAGVPEAPTDDQVGMAPPPTPAAPPERRGVPLWAALVGALVAALVGFGAGFAIYAGDADAVRDDLEAAEASLSESEASLSEAEASLSEAEAALAQCQDAVEGGTALATASDELATAWNEYLGLLTDFNATPLGSPEEAELSNALIEAEGQVNSKVGAATATADRVIADSEACASA